MFGMGRNLTLISSLLAEFNKTVATWSLWGHKAPELTEVKTPGGPTQGLPHRVPSSWLEGSLFLLPSWPLCVKMIPESKLTCSEAGRHRNTWHISGRNKLPGHMLYCRSLG